MAFRTEFKEALNLLAHAIATLTSRGIEPPILVGGAAVEFYTGSAVVSGDFDFVTPHQEEFEEAFEAHGFERVLAPGFLVRSLVHRRLGFGVQVVSGLLMDGRARRDKIMVVEIAEEAIISVISAEDLIADRMGQAYATAPPRDDMLDQAVKLYQLATDLDASYLGRRISEETGGSADLSTLLRSAL